MGTVTDGAVNIEALAALRCVLGEEFPRLIRDFRVLAAESLLTISAARTHEDRVALKSSAHALRGAALNLYSGAVAHQCSLIESKSASHPFPLIDDDIDALHTQVSSALAIIDRWLEAQASD